MTEKQTVHADRLARDFFKIIVEEGENSPGGQPERFYVPETAHSAFRAKMRLYREALILCVILMKAGSVENYKEVAWRFHDIILPEVPLTAMKDNALNIAMREMYDYYIKKGTEKDSLSWSRRWVSSIDVDQTNPITLHLFWVYWANLYLAVRDSANDIEPVPSP